MKEYKRPNEESLDTRPPQDETLHSFITTAQEVVRDNQRKFIVNTDGDRKIGDLFVREEYSGKEVIVLYNLVDPEPFRGKNGKRFVGEEIAVTRENGEVSHSFRYAETSITGEALVDPNASEAPLSSALARIQAGFFSETDLRKKVEQLQKVTKGDDVKNLEGVSKNEVAAAKKDAAFLKRFGKDLKKQVRRVVTLTEQAGNESVYQTSNPETIGYEAFYEIGEAQSVFIQTEVGKRGDHNFINVEVADIDAGKTRYTWNDEGSTFLVSKAEANVPLFRVVPSTMEERKKLLRTLASLNKTQSKHPPQEDRFTW